MATVNITHVKDVRLFEITGRLDSELAAEMGKALEQALGEGDDKLVLDLGGVDYISSPGLREIVRAYKRAQSGGGSLHIANPSERVMDVLKLAGLDTIIPIFRSAAQAIDSF
jgi:anti-sigma B factor antagonist